MATTEAPPDPNRLKNHFASNPADSSKWDDLWSTSYTPWDRALPSPALRDLLSSRHPALNRPVIAPKDPVPTNGTQRIRRPRALVPGCGRGYDVFLFASWGFDAFGVEVSPKAAEAARKEGRRIDQEREGGGDEGAEDRREAYKVHDEKVGRGEWKVLEGDFFSDGWWEASMEGLRERGFDKKEGFDLIYDYTFFCALPPQLRPKWAARMAQLLSPTGRLICLEFPSYKDPSTGGPPWAVRSKAYIAHLSKPGEEVELGEDGFVTGVDEENPTRNKDGLVRIAHFQPERTHEVGKGTDWLSVWKHQ